MGSQPETHDEGRAGAWMGLLIVFVLAASVISFIVAARIWWLPPLASVEGATIDWIFNAILLVTAIAFVAVHVFLALALFRYPARGGERAAHWHEHLGAELTWTLVPAVGLLLLTVLAEVVWARISSAPPANALVVEVVGRQFNWIIRYPGPGGRLGRTDPKFLTQGNLVGLDPADPAGRDNVIVINELHVVRGRPVAVRLRALDVIHSFFLPNFRVKQDLLPGRETETWFTPDRTGQFQIACAQLCGVGHYTMRGNITVEPDQAAFDAWLETQRQH